MTGITAAILVVGCTILFAIGLALWALLARRLPRDAQVSAIGAFHSRRSCMGWEGGWEVAEPPSVDR